MGCPHAKILGRGYIVNNLIDNLVVNLFGSINMVLYLCIDNERSSRAGSLGDVWSVDSTTPYNIYKGLTIKC